MSIVDLNKITARSSLKDLEGLQFKGDKDTVQKFIKLLVFSLPFFSISHLPGKN